MDRTEFEMLRKLPGKEIEDTIEFVPIKKMQEHIVGFERATVLNSLEYGISVSGQHNRRTKRITYTFWIDGIGMVCRVCVNGAVHRRGNAGRTHKHELMQETDPDNDLPYAVPRSDLEGKTPRQIWETICRQAGIEHTGTFIDP